MTLLILTEADVAELLSGRDALDAVEAAFRAQADQQAVLPLRRAAVVTKGLMGSMPGALLSGTPALGAKLVTFFPDNTRLHTHQALIALFDVDDGRPLSVMDGRLITELRTAAASAAATRALAAPSSSKVAILGTGVQASSHARALAGVLRLEEVRIWGRNRLHAQGLARELSTQKIPARAVDTPAQACAGAHVVCTTTAAHEPIVSRDDVDAGTHINAVGASTPRMREISGDLMAAAAIFVDSVEGALNESGDIIQAMSEGALPQQPRLTLLADVIAGRTVGRTSPQEITLFKSLGIALWDLACATLVYERAVKNGKGSRVDF